MSNLSKSRIQYGRQCHKRLWLDAHLRDAAEWSSSAQSRLDEGTHFGELAQALLGGGHLVAAGHMQVAQALDETASLLAQPWQDVPMIFEAAFSHEGVRVRVDAFQRGEDGDTLIEVKSTTKVKNEYLWDCAIQTWVARGSGRSVTRVLLGHVDSSFVYTCEGDYTGLLALADITDEVEALLTRIPGLVQDLHAVADGPMPPIQTGQQCSTPYNCPFLSHCRRDEPQGPEYPVELLPYGGSIVERLRERGYADLRDVPESLLANERHRRIAAATRTGVAFVGEALRPTLDAIGYPRHYLDFETISFVTPRWLGTRPFQQIPFQFSCHHEQAGGELTHSEFLDTSGNSPIEPFASAVIVNVGTEGPVLVWNQSFEAARLRELAAMLPHHAEALHRIIDRMVDLLPIYRDHYYHPAMRGSWSIKSVLPTIAPDLDYADLSVGDGNAAQDAYRAAIAATDTASEERERLRADLLKYCARDTEAMVRLTLTGGCE